MKKIILILGLIIVTQLETKAQQEKQFIAVANYTTLKPMYSSGYNLPEKDYAYYNRKSRNQRITGLSLLGGGLVLGVAGILVTSSNSTYSDVNYESRGETAVTLFILSAATGIASIPFMILAHVNKTKARAALSVQKTSFGIPGMTEKNIAGLTVSIPIGK
jgi:hypothetical protein